LAQGDLVQNSLVGSSAHLLPCCLPVQWLLVTTYVVALEVFVECFLGDVRRNYGWSGSQHY